MVVFAFGAFAGVEGFAGGIEADGAERGLVEHAFESAIAAGGAVQVARIA